MSEVSLKMQHHCSAIELNGDIEAIFKLSRCPTSVQNAIDGYPSQLRDRLTFSRELALPAGSEKPEAIFLHPGRTDF